MKNLKRFLITKDYPRGASAVWYGVSEGKGKVPMSNFCTTEFERLTGLRLKFKESAEVRLQVIRIQRKRGKA